MKMDYGIRTKVDLPFDKAIEKVKEELSKEGFGILTQIDVKDTLKKKINVDFKNYTILGACNPNFAHKALLEEEELGLLLPCNVIVYENKNNEIIVSAINPKVGMGFIENKKLEEISIDVNKKLNKVISNLNEKLKW